ncbi:MAG TPA: serine protease [Tepidisphaeraceae bacterium]|jgi:hypothetical protein|nr:serine protease [Tepidisphaeraceae bacterium]
MVRSRITFPWVLSVLVPAGLVLAGHGGGGHGGGFGGFGQNGGMGWSRNSQTKPPVDPKVAAQKLREKIAKLLDDGFADLRASDTAAALDAFSDVIQLQPDSPLGHLGMGLARAQKRQFESSEAEFITAANDARRAKANTRPDPDADPKIDSPSAYQADIRLANYDLAVTFTRMESRPRALVLLDRAVIESKPVDETLVNAQRSLLAIMDAKAKSAIAAMPAMLKTLHTAETSLTALHAPLKRWGVTWMAEKDASKHYYAGEAEPLPKVLPFLMPLDEVMPELAKKGAEKNAVVADGTNPLSPVIAPDVQVAEGPAPVPPPAAGDATPVPPTAAPAGAAAPADVPAPAAASGDASASPSPVPPPVASTKAPAAPLTRTVTGAAFAVGPDLLLTCSRLTSGAKSIAVQATDGANYDATIVASDDASGLALIKVEGGHFTPLALADTATSGAVHIPAFIRPGVFGPELDVLPGTLSVSTSAAFLHAATHPRSAGSPLMDAHGKVVGILTATRDDPIAHLPVVTAETIRKFADGKFTSATETAASGPEDCVLELSATREE